MPTHTTFVRHNPKDRVNSAPLNADELLLDLGEQTIPGLFFDTPEEALQAKSRLRLYRSKHSGLVQLDTDLIPESYYYYKLGAPNQQHRDHLEATAVHIASLLPKEARILEIGGASGNLMRALHNQGFRNLTVIDPSADNASDLLFASIPACFPEGLKGSSETFDLIIAQHFLEHSEDPVSVLAAASRFLSPSGKIWMEVPDLEASAIADKGEWLSMVYALHTSYFDSSTLVKVGHAAGLATLSCFPVEHYGKSLVALYQRADSGTLAPQESNKEGASAVDAAIKHYFAELEAFGRLIPPGTLAWGAAERCQAILGSCERGGFRTAEICDSNPALWGKFLSGMTRPVTPPPQEEGSIKHLLILSLQNVSAIVKSCQRQLAADARIYVPLRGVLSPAQCLCN